MEFISTKTIMPLHARKGDELSVKYIDINGVEHKLDSMQIDHDMVIDQISFFKVCDELGFSDGIAAVIGKAKEFS